MKPRLYNKSQSWKYNGYGFLNQCISCEVTTDDECNYTAQIKVLPGDRLYNLLETGLLVRVKPNHTDPTQFLEIENIKVDNQGIATIEASHIKSNFFNNILKTDCVSTWTLRGSASSVLSQILSSAIVHRNWKSTSDIDHSYSDIIELYGFDSEEKTLEIKPPLSFKDVFFGDNGFVKTFGGEFRFNNEKIYIYKERGSLKSIPPLRFGSGLSDYEQEMSNSEMYDAVVLYATVKGDDDKSYLVVNSFPADQYNEAMDALIGTSYNKRFLFEDRSSKFSDITYETISGSLTPEEKARIKEVLFLAARLTYNNKGITISQPSVNIKVNTADQIKKLKYVGLYDSVRIQCSNSTIITEKVSKVVYDSLREVYISHEFGEKKLSLTDLIKI